MSTPAGQVPGTEATQPEAATPLRFVTAASLFDGHDAAINIMRRILQASGAEVIHLGHNRSVKEIVALDPTARVVALGAAILIHSATLLELASTNAVRAFEDGGTTERHRELLEARAGKKPVDQGG